MWGFMKPPKLKTVCKNQPTQEAVKKLEEYRRYALASMEAYYKKICEELAHTDPDTLEEITKAVTEYKEMLTSMNQKMSELQHLNKDVIQNIGAELVLNYNAENERLNLGVQVSVDE